MDEHYFEIVVNNGDSKDIIRFEDIFAAENYAESHFGRQLICGVEFANAILSRKEGNIPYDRYVKIAVA